MKKLYIINALPYSSALTRMLEVNPHPAIFFDEICKSLTNQPDNTVGMDDYVAYTKELITGIFAASDNIFFVVPASTKAMRDRWIDPSWVRVIIEADDDVEKCLKQAREHGDDTACIRLENYNFSPITMDELSPCELAVGTLIHQGMIVF